MKVFAKFDEIPSMTLQDIKERKNVTDGRTDGRTVGLSVGQLVGQSVGQRENSIPFHKHSLLGV